MEPVVTSSTMQACDRFAIENLKIPGLVLMENAGRGVVDLMERRFAPLDAKSVLIFCGTGNNGGDGFVVARHLMNRGCTVSVVILGRKSQLTGDAKTNFLSLEQIQKHYRNGRNGRCPLQITSMQSARQLSVLPNPDIIVDALFGIGFKGELRGFQKDVVNWINGNGAERISIDIPSGVNADNGRVRNTAVSASVTATMGFRKIGLIIGKGRDYSGTSEVIDIGLPRVCFDQKALNTSIVSKDDIHSILPVRLSTAHKHSVGKIFVLAGSRGLTGAAALTATSAMRAGAGSVILGTPSAVYPVLAGKLTEVMVEPLPDTGDGTLSLGAFQAMQKYLEWADILILGPGLSRNPDTQQLVWKLVAECELPLLVDADGLNALAEKMSILKKHKSKNIILTPHEGEFARLKSISHEHIEDSRIELGREMAKEYKLTLVLKGAPTVTISENGIAVINATGNAGMATAGSGDVLSGIIGGLWGQGMKRNEAAYAGVFIHGYAGDLAKVKYGEKGLLATDILELLPDALQHIER